MTMQPKKPDYSFVPFQKLTLNETNSLGFNSRPLSFGSTAENTQKKMAPSILNQTIIVSDTIETDEKSYEYALMHYNEKNYVEAFVYFYKVAKNDHNSAAFYYMGLMLYEGQGVQADSQRAFRALSKAALGGHIKACAKLGDWYCREETPSYSEAAEWYKKATSDKDAQSGLGFLYYHGYGVPKDLAIAFQFFTMAANAEQREAQFHLGLCYHHGHGTKANRTLAALWYKAASEQGHLTAAYNAGILYYEGIQLLQPDYKLAMSYYLKAAEGNYANAMCNIGFLYEKGYGVLLDYKTAFTWYERASNLGSHQAMQNLGELYLKGLGTDVDLDLALKYFKQAKEGGIVESEEYIQQVNLKKKLQSIPESKYMSHPTFDLVFQLKKQLEQVKNESQSLIEQKDRKIAVLLDQIKAQHNQLDALISEIAKN